MAKKSLVVLGRNVLFLGLIVFALTLIIPFGLGVDAYMLYEKWIVPLGFLLTSAGLIILVVGLVLKE